MAAFFCAPGVSFGTSIFLRSFYPIKLKFGQVVPLTAGRHITKYQVWHEAVSQNIKFINISASPMLCYEKYSDWEFKVMHQRGIRF